MERQAPVEAAPEAAEVVEVETEGSTAEEIIETAETEAAAETVEE